MVADQVEYNDLLQALTSACEEMGLQAVDSFVAKCIQLYETTLVRHGLMLVGPTMGGKTACYSALQKVCHTVVCADGVLVPLQLPCKSNNLHAAYMMLPAIGHATHFALAFNFAFKSFATAYQQGGHMSDRPAQMGAMEMMMCQKALKWQLNVTCDFAGRL